ncbi:MAG TPA: lipopolysaccharide biosynthesis protein [bacterium]|nr:lipopolysaccharide biosynthesis protein [bacterium]
MISNLSGQQETLFHRTIKSGFWVFSLRIINQLFQLVRTIILARLLSPDDFGLFGIALLTLSALDTFSQTGFYQPLIQKKEDTAPYLNTAWTVQIIRGLLIALVLFFIAPYVAIFFKSPPAVPILKIIGFAIILQSFTNISVIYFEKELRFNKYFAYQLFGTIADLIVSLTAAFLLRSVWALVFGLLAGNLVRCVMSYVISAYRPRFQFNKTQIKELFEFGRWILGSNILVFLITHGDDIFVGKLLGTIMLGFYQMAYKISNMPATEITNVISLVTFPVYSKLQDNLTRLKEAYLKVLQFTAFLSFPIAGLIFVLAPDFTKIFLGEKWMPMVPAMQVLAWWGVIRGLVGAISPVFMAIGKPKIVTHMQAVQTLLLMGLIYPLTVHWNIFGASLSVFLSALAMFFIRNHILIKTINCKISEFYKTMVIPMVLTLVCIFLILILKNLVIQSINIYSFIFFIGIFILVFGLLVYNIDKFLDYKLRIIIKEIIRSL